MRISVVIIGVTDMQRAVRFYEKALGLPPKSQSAEYSEFATAGAALRIREARCCLYVWIIVHSTNRRHWRSVTNS